MDTVEVRQRIVTTLIRRGKGTEESPIRILTEVWDAETGHKIADSDPDLVYDNITDTFIRLRDSEEYQI